MQRIMLTDSAVVGSNIYKAGTIFPNKDVPELLNCLHQRVKKGYAKYIGDEPVDIPEKVVEFVGEVKLPDMTPEAKEALESIAAKEKLDKEETSKKEESEKKPRGNPSFRLKGKKDEKDIED